MTSSFFQHRLLFLILGNGAVPAALRTLSTRDRSASNLPIDKFDFLFLHINQLPIFSARKSGKYILRKPNADSIFHAIVVTPLAQEHPPAAAARSR
jgi:hypothetical protein